MKFSGLHLSDRSKLVWLAVLSVVAAAFFVFSGLNADNIGFFLPRRLEKIVAILL